MKQYAILSTPDGFVFGHLIKSVTARGGGCYQHLYIMPSGIYKAFYPAEVVAEYDNPVLCKQAMGRAKALEKALRPGWQAAIEHERRMHRAMIEAVWAAAKDGEP